MLRECPEEKFVGTVSVHKTSGTEDSVRQLRCLYKGSGQRIIKFSRCLFVNT
ncbi:MAG: hypothetical protein HC903_03260 [Methylacidiphilales bacterium]|nr:hypothetical protein [Candidatus Methylacidiphilales bacterium]